MPDSNSFADVANFSEDRSLPREELEIAIRARLGARLSCFNVNFSEGTVVLRGFVGNDEDKQLAGIVCREFVQAVTTIDNQIKIAADPHCTSTTSVPNVVAESSQFDADFERRYGQNSHEAFGQELVRHFHEAKQRSLSKDTNEP